MDWAQLRCKEASQYYNSSIMRADLCRVLNEAVHRGMLRTLFVDIMDDILQRGY